ncbi:polymer-forming cytoskeletal protein [Caproicibacter sp.]|uniref:polymer-forming cytoskeletal protein n=1 Tax=Caproicibacter sp. TaxID=2814884 RepID=UPI003989A45E
MKKFRGKALAALLSLALIASSLPVTLASASTRSMSGIVNHQLNDDIYLVNGGKSREATITDFLVASDTLVTNTREEVDNPKIAAISHVSGDSLVSLKLIGDDDDTAKLKLKSNDKSGTEVIAVLYEGDYTDDDTDTDYTVKARKNVTIHVFDKDQPVFGKVSDGAIDPGKAPDDLDTFAKTRNYKAHVGIFAAEPDDSNDSCFATYSPVDLTAQTSTSETISINDKDTPTYSIEITSGDSDVHLSDSDLLATNEKDNASYNGVVATTTGAGVAVVVGKGDYKDGKYSKDASTSNVTFTLKKVKSDGKISTSSDDKYTLKTKVEDKVDVTTALTNAGVADKKTFEVCKDGKTRIKAVKESTDSNAKDLDVTNSIVVFPSNTTSVTVDDSTNLKGIEGTVGQNSKDSTGLSIGDARVGYVDVDCGDVELADGRVGDITTSGETGKVTISSGTTGKIKTTDCKDAAPQDVEINGGIVGDVESDGTVTVDSSDEDTKVVTGTLKAPIIDVYADEASVTIGELLAKADGTITVRGNSAEIKAIDLDSYETTVDLGNDDDEFTGTIPAPKNATKGTIETVNEDTAATVNGDVDVDTINLDSDTTTTFTGKITVDTVEGDGCMVVKAGNMYVSGSVSGTQLKLSDSTLAAGTTVFKAAADEVDPEDFSCYGFTLTKSEGNSVDTFKIDTLSFAGLQINKSSSSIAKGQSETFTASAYPGGTSLPAGYTIGWKLDGGNSDVFSMTSSGNTATVTVNSIDPDFPSENHTGLTAKLYDADGYEVDSEDYGDAVCNITATEVPVIQSDTTKDFTMAPGATYQFKITAPTAPVMTAGSAGVISSITNVGKSGNDYFIKITAAANANGKATGIYVNGTKLLVVTVSGSQTFKSDTTAALTVKKGASYQYGITTNNGAAPTFTLGSSNVFHYELVGHNGSTYFFKVTAVGAVGAQTGVYVNGTKVNVAKVG